MYLTRLERNKNAGSPAKLKQFETEKAKYENDLRLWQSYTNIFKNDTVGFFDIKYFFPQVDGFDVVIGNPPYVFARNESFTAAEKKYYS